MNKLIKLGVSAFSVLAMAAPAFAAGAAIGTASVTVGSSSFGNITGIDTLLTFVINLIRYVGWALIFIAILMAIVSIAVNIMQDSDKSKEAMQKGLTNAVLIIIVGLLLWSISFMFQFVANIFGLAGTFSTEVVTVTTN